MPVDYTVMSFASKNLERRSWGYLQPWDDPRNAQFCLRMLTVPFPDHQSLAFKFYWTESLSLLHFLVYPVKNNP